MIQCDDDSLYTGISNNVARRLQQHASARGAKYFRGRRPQALVYLEEGHDRSTASRREAEIKKMQRVQKQQLIGQMADPVRLQQLSEVLNGTE